ncbi:hypothetical protein [Deinococcus hohokamensis]|uniref:Transposase n=1 Tax=Deinococcus hohokamensis TaxID=309883 RepID=A0ABV9I801_9DEIO
MNPGVERRVLLASKLRGVSRTPARLAVGLAITEHAARNLAQILVLRRLVCDHHATAPPFAAPR